MNSILLHDCSEPIVLTSSDTDCLSTLANTYRFVTILGSGMEGVAIKINKDQRFFAIKISKAQDSKKSLKMACKLNELKDYTGIFVYTYGWLVCNSIPDDWLRFMDPYEEKSLLLFTVMEISALKWSDVILTKEELVICFLILMHGFYIAKKKLGFAHNDLHPGNLLLQAIPYKESEIYLEVYPDLVFKVTGEQTRFVPKIIDFGMAVTEGRDNDDLSDIKDMFEREANIFGAISNDAMDESNFENPLFEKYKTESRKKGKTCFMCSSVAKFEREEDGRFTFCSQACSNVF
jgi:serine/threonine protein kinase